MGNVHVHIKKPKLPLLWDGKSYTIEEWGIAKRKPYVKINPHNSQLVAKIKQRLKKDSNVTLGKGDGYCYLDGEEGLK